MTEEEIRAIVRDEIAKAQRPVTINVEAEPSAILDEYLRASLRRIRQRYS